MDVSYDILNHPIVKTTQAVLEKGDIKPILKWVNKEKGKDIHDLFKRTLRIRNQGKDAQEIADRYFLKTFVRSHLVGKGKTYTSKLHGGVVGPAVIEADKNLEPVSVDALVKFIIRKVREGIHEHFAKVKEAEKHANHSIEANREYMEAYTQFTHYAEWSTMMLQCIQDAITGRTSGIQGEY